MSFLHFLFNLASAIWIAGVVWALLCMTAGRYFPGPSRGAVETIKS